jgi:hypothetical protein
VKIIISVQSGRVLNQIDQGLVNTGLNKVDFTSEGLSSGFYLYTLVIDDNISDTKKMTVLK